jgi:hypothetical protein
MDDDIKALIILLAVMGTIFVLYYVLWVIPYHDALYNIMDCMGQETSQAAYTQCAEELK